MDRHLAFSGRSGNSVEAGLNLGRFSNVPANDLFLFFAQYFYDVAGTVSPSTVTHNQSTWRTAVKNRPSFLDGLSMFFEVLSTGKISQHKPFGNWHPRERLSVNGASLQGALLYNLKVYQFIDVSEESFRNIPIDLLIKQGEYFLCYSDHFFDYVRRVVQTAGRSFAYTYLYGVEGMHSYKINVLRSSESLLEYEGLLLGSTESHPLDGGYLSYHVLIHRDYDVPEKMVVNISRTKLFSMAGGLPTGSPIPVDLDGSYHQQMTLVPVDGFQALLDFRDACAVSIITCVPALYHTQSHAIVNLLSTVSRNFETLMESPELAPSLLALASESKSGLLASLSGEETRMVKLFPVTEHIPWFDRIRTVVKLVISGYFAYIFATRPTLVTILDVIKTSFLRGTKQSGEDTMIFRGGLDDYAALPNGMRALINACVPEDVMRFEITFRTTCSIQLSDDKYAELLSTIINSCTRFGITPDPSYLWAMQPFTFVIDEFIPVNALIKDAQTRLTAVGMRDVTIGHSVSFLITTRTGRRFHIYIRSDASTVYLDPKGDSWLRASGASLPVLIPLALQMLL